MNPDEIKAGIAVVQAALTAMNSKLTDLPADQQFVLTSLTLAGMIDPELAPLAAVEPLAYALLVWIITHNTQGQPFSQTPMHGGPPSSQVE